VILGLEDPESVGRVKIGNSLVLLIGGVPVEFDLYNPSVRAHKSVEVRENLRVPSYLRY
jgi:hypothetical protein